MKFLFFVLCLTACASTHWAKFGASTQDFNQDAAFCRNDAYTRATNALGQTDLYTQRPLYNNCMMSKGWHVEDDK